MNMKKFGSIAQLIGIILLAFILVFAIFITLIPSFSDAGFGVRTVFAKRP